MAAKTWELILSAGKYTGANEVHLDPNNPDTVYASTHQRFRNVAALMDGGPESGIHKSTDGGKTWRELTNGIPKEDKGKIGLSHIPGQTRALFMQPLNWRNGPAVCGVRSMPVKAGKNAAMRSTAVPGHITTRKFSPARMMWIPSTRSHPHCIEQWMVAKPCKPVKNETVHGDYHAVVFDPTDPDYLMVGTDGGVYESFR